MPTTSRARTWFIVLGGVLIGVGLGAGIYFALTPASASFLEEATPPALVQPPAPIIGAPAPDFSLATLDGRSITLSQLRGQVVLVNFWATWCGPCAVEFPAFDDRFARYHSQGFIILAVNASESSAEIERFRQEMGTRLPLLLDPGDTVQRLYRIIGLPTSFIIDRQGIIRDLHIGLMTEAELDAYLAAAGIDL